ncbi:DUF3907 family protein [Paenibacillus turpanensis]|uniref:DUF3907 family protein n=1 Tax=Paenibacillus turpanensis TaxID=2689078 RepID=UPI00140E91A6|nr:DUF3907 family protein [Paenibacillus turpanensis]
MAVYKVQSLCETTSAKLKEAIQKLELFLNTNSLTQLNPEQDASMEEFYRDYLSDLRRLSVFSEVCYEKVGLNLRRPSFNVDQAEKALYETYHNCVNNFFYPKNECYSEDGRYAYTGQDAIRFRKKPSREIRDLTLELSKVFEVLREELAYYETDYITQRRMQGEKV